VARILIGWEFGANRGHAVRLAALAEALRAQGHETVFALQRIDALAPAEAGGSAIWQAPVTPRLLVTARRSLGRAPAGMADILARLGFDDPAIVAAMIGGWRRLLEAVRPDAVIGDFAPFLMLAARGSAPTLLVGTGFTAPPAGMAAFPNLVAGVEGVDQKALLTAVNAGLAAAGAAPLAALPQIFAADRPLAADFAEIDPYADARAEPLLDPLPRGFGASAADGEEVFVYAPETVGADAPLWRGLAEAKLPTRVHVPRAPASLREAVARLGFTFEPEPVPFARIARRSRLLVSHGGHGFLCAGLAAGLPQVVCHYDLEKLLNGLAVARLGVGGHVPLASIEPNAFATSLVRLHRDDGLASRARAAAARFRRNGQRPLRDAVLEAVAALA